MSTIHSNFSGIVSLLSPILRHSVIMLAMDFQLVTSYTPRGDQRRSIEELAGGPGLAFGIWDSCKPASVSYRI